MQYTLYDQAAHARRQSEDAAAKAQQIQANRDLLQQQLAMHETLLDQTRHAMQAISQQIEHNDHLRDLRRQEHSQALDARRTALTTLKEDLDQISSRYAQEIDQRLDDATQQAQRAVKLVQEAIGMTKREKRSAQLELLARKTQQVAVLCDHILIAASHHQMITALLQNASGPGLQQASLLPTTAGQDAAKHKQLIDTAATTIDDALGLVQQLRTGVPDTDPFATQIDDQADVLDRYRKQVAMIEPDGISTDDAHAPTPQAEPPQTQLTAPPAEVSEVQPTEMRSSDAPMK